MMNRNSVWAHLEGADGGFVDMNNQMSTQNATIIEITVSTPGGKLMVFSGTARRDPRDKPNAEIGYQLALGRALRSAGRVILKDANKAVRAEEVRKQRHLQASLEAKARREARTLAQRTRTPNDPVIRTGQLGTVPEIFAAMAGKLLAEDEVETRDEWMERQYGNEDGPLTAAVKKRAAKKKDK